MTSVSTFMMSFVRCPIRATRRSNEPRVDSFASRAASNAWSTRLSRAANRSAEVSVESRSSSGCASATTTSRCGESARSQSPDGAAELDEPRQVVGDALRDVGHDLRVQLLELALDSLKGAEVAGDDPLDNRCDKRR